MSLLSIPLEHPEVYLPSIVLTVIMILYIAATWKIFTKAGRPGWACLIPIYNSIVMLKIAKMSPWLIFLFLIPIVNIFLSFLLCINLASAFNRGTGFAFGLVFLSFIFVPILGFGSSEYDFDEEN